MLVYGDRARSICPYEALEALEAQLADAAGRRPGLDRHTRLCSALIEAGGLAQGLADAAFSRRGGVDGHDPAADMAQHLTQDFASAVAGSWRSGFASSSSLATPGLDRLRAHLPSDLIEVRTCEGYAFYGVYPELYVEAAAALHPLPRVIGLRSIGASLAAAAAAGRGAEAAVTLRPAGDPFARSVRLEDSLAAELAAPSPGGWAVVDEGPGQSGSSFAAVGAFLQAQGAPADRVIYLPSHGGGPGPKASPAVNVFWTGGRTARVDFEDAILPRLAAWAEPLVGPALQPLVDLSAGRWRDAVPAPLHEAPAWPAQERRKFRLSTEAGTFLLKFAGLGRIGEAKLERARALYREGFGTEPIGLIHGFLAERWIPQGPAGVGDFPLEQLAAYLDFRVQGLPPPEPGADSQGLREMMVRNLSLAGLPRAAEVAARLATGVVGPPMAIDGRLHAWEWRATGGGVLLKTDALDHCEAHDLIGAQDLAWDVAGAAVEFGLASAGIERLRRRLERLTRRPLDPRRIAFAHLGYLAFQLGWWRLAEGGGGGQPAAEQARRYRSLARNWTPPE